MDAFFIPASLVAGGLLAVQAGANAQLSKATGSPFTATTLQLSVGTLALLAVALATGTLTALAGLSGVPWWHVIGGTASAFYVVSTILLFPRLGAVVAVGLFIAGQMLASFALDTFGLLGVAPKALTPAMAGGTLAVLLGAGAIVAGQAGSLRQALAGKAGWIVLALLAGAVLPVQGVVNGLLRQDLGAPFAVGAVSFFVATLAMALALLLVTLFRRAPAARAPQGTALRGMPWWGWLGGFAGAAYVTTVFTAIPAIGAAAAVGLTVAGQQVASVFVDRYGWFRLPQRPVSGLRTAGVAVLLLGVAIIKLL
ncbi:DMT family transporter [Variovorax boronicumulans]|uniref:DMT family transporter n=1 Tax=Variovorax boronicumulans TaxID=436515 RepID=UPI0012E502EF|nr:DMT family transporter [Variovorax boronicumulans]GER18865.1 EamA-like transporter family protein [Variovorax boronicumulans]